MMANNGESKTFFEYRLFPISKRSYRIMNDPMLLLIFIGKSIENPSYIDMYNKESNKVISRILFGQYFSNLAKFAYLHKCSILMPDLIPKSFITKLDILEGKAYGYMFGICFIGIFFLTLFFKKTIFNTYNHKSIISSVFSLSSISIFMYYDLKHKNKFFSNLIEKFWTEEYESIFKMCYNKKLENILLTRILIINEEKKLRKI